MGNTHQLENKKNNQHCFFPVVSPLFYKNHFQYVNIQNSDKVLQRVIETRHNNIRSGELIHKNTMDNTISSAKNKATMKTFDQIQDQTKCHNDNVEEPHRPRIGERGDGSNSTSPSNSNLNFSNCEISSHLQDDTTTKSLNIATSNVASLNAQGRGTPSMVSFSNLWLPFRSPFRRAVFSADVKAFTQHNDSRLSEDTIQQIPMASSSSRFETSGPMCSQQTQFTPWAHQYAVHSQPSESNPMVMESLPNGDMPIHLSNYTLCDESFFHKTQQCSKGNIVDNTTDTKCYSGLVPSLFQTSPTTLQTSETNPNSSSFTSVKQDTTHASNEEKKKSESSNSKKQGIIPIRLNRRGRNDGSRAKELRNQENQRLNSKKQRAAHQASSPSSSANLNRYGSFNRPFSRDREASPPPSIRVINSLKVTLIDEPLKVFVVDLLTPETCELVKRMTNEHVKRVTASGSNIATWRTLYTYTKRDLPCSEVKGLTSRVTDHIMASIIDIVGAIFDKKDEASKLHPRSWKEPHLLSYIKLEGQTPHTGVEMHYDGCDITWNCMLSKSSEYDGGGTYIRALRKTVRLEQGQVLVHPGELYHKGCDITRGKRDLIVCFMDGFDPQIVDSSSAQEDKVSYEQNVRSY